MVYQSSVEEYLSADERAQQQLERLQSTLNRAYRNVVFYRDRFNEHGVDPFALEELSELSTLPFTHRVHLSENYPYGLFAVPLRDIVTIHTAPGTSLNPTVSGYTAGDLSNWRSLVARALSAGGVTQADILQIVLETGLANWGRDYKNGAEAIDTSVIPFTPLSPDKQLMVLKDYRASVLITSPSAAGALSRIIAESPISPSELALAAIILVGEPPSDTVRRSIEEALHVRTRVHYGLSEVPGAAIGFECSEQNGLHISEDHFLPEVIDPETGETVPPGEPGELALTTLTARAFPLVRFRTGDRVRLLTDPCPCGRTLARIQWLPGRTDSMAVIRGVKVHPRQLEELLARELGGHPPLHRFGVVHRGLGDYLEVSLVVDDSLFSDEIKELENRCQSLRREFTRELGIPVLVRLMEPSSFKGSPGGTEIEDLR